MKRTAVRLISSVILAVMCLTTFVSCTQPLEEFAGDLRERFDYDLSKYVTPGKYKGIKVNIGPSEPTTEQIRAEMLSYRGYYGIQERIYEGTAEVENIAEVKYQAYIDGKPIAGFTDGRDDGYSMLLGADDLVEGFDVHVIGMAIGEKKTVEFKMPDPCFKYAEYAGETLTFELELVGIRVLDLPSLDDEFAAEYGGAGSVDAFESNLVQEWKNRRNSALKDYVLTRVYESIYNSFKIKEIPEKEYNEVYDAQIAMIKEEAVEDRVDTLIEADEAKAEAEGMEFEKYVTEVLGFESEEKYEQSLTDSVKKDTTVYETYVKEELEYASIADMEADLAEWSREYVEQLMVRYYIARKEKLVLTNAEFDERATVLAQENGLSSPAEYVSFMAYYGYSEYDVREDLWFCMVDDFLYENAVQVEG